MAVDAPSEGSSSAAAAAAAPPKKLSFVGDGGVTCPRNNGEVRNPMSKGLIKDWEGMEILWDYLFNQKLRVNVQEHPVLLSEPSFNPREIREKTTEIFFEKYQTPGLYLCKDAVLSAFSAGRATALVLDSGSEVTRAVPVQDGYVLKKNIAKQNLAGNEISNEVLAFFERQSIDPTPYYKIAEKQQVEQNQPHKAKFREFSFPISNSFDTYMKMKLANEFKEAVCQISDVKFNEANLARLPLKPFEFPTGYNTAFGVDRFRIAEVLFNPSQGLTSKANLMDVDEIDKAPAKLFSVQRLVYDAISKCDPDLRVNFFGNVLVTGGNTMFPGFPERLYSELMSLAPSYKTKIIAPTNSVERRFSSWVGGSILTSLGSFHQMWISKAEYDETGKSIVEKKCP